jgi:hypothetical protein
VQLDARFWLWSAAATAVTLLLMGIPTAIIPNAVFGRSVAVEPWAVATWVASSVLVGLIAGTYLAPVATARHVRPHGEAGGARVTVGAALAYFAVACPVCNKIVVAVLGVTGALNVFAPLQPIMAATSVALLGATLAWRLRMRARGCSVCAAALPAGDTGEPRPLGGPPQP